VQDELLKNEPKVMRDALREALSVLTTQVNNELVEKFTSHLRGGFGVLSLAEDPLSCLMWSHYSDSHRGFCIEYDFDALPYGDLGDVCAFPSCTDVNLRMPRATWHGRTERILTTCSVSCCVC
jgi:Protein of unknown function (DUF2971)